MAGTDPNRGETRFLLLVLLGGLALRLLWLVQVEGSITGPFGSGEATRVALALARGRGFADAYYEGYGPTAHLLPVTPMLAGGLLWLFGPGSVAANLALLGWCLAQVGAAYLLLRALFLRIGMNPLAVRWGFVLLCLVPVFAHQETIDFRFWEGAFALALAALNLWWIDRLRGSADPAWRALLAAAALAAATFFVCPPVGLATGACWAWFALRLPLERSLLLAGAAAAALALLVTPWAVRNARVLGEPVVLRSNLGLELALANHADAVSGRAPEAIFADRLMAIHPYQPGPGRARLAAAGGEIAYSRALGAEAWRWIIGHPADSAGLSLRHLSEFFFPRPWQMYFSGWEDWRAPRALAIALVDLLGLIGIATGLVQRRRGFAMLATYVALVALPFALLQPTVRYTYLVAPLLAFPAVALLFAARRYAISGLGWAR